MGKINFWKIQPRRMIRMVDDMVEVINETSDKFLLNTIFVDDIDKFLSHDDSHAVIMEMIKYIFSNSFGFPPPPKIKNRIQRSLNKDIGVYIQVEEILRLGILSRDQLQLYQNTGLIEIELFPERNSIGYPWKVIKQLAR